MAVNRLLDAWEYGAILGNVGQGHFLRDVVLTLKRRTEVDIVRCFHLEVGSTKVVEPAVTNDCVAVDLMHWSLSCKLQSMRSKTY